VYATSHTLKRDSVFVVWHQKEPPVSERRVDKHGFCTLQQSQSVPYQSNKLEYVARSPDVMLFHDFVSQNEAERLKEMAIPAVCMRKMSPKIWTGQKYARHFTVVCSFTATAQCNILFNALQIF